MYYMPSTIPSSMFISFCLIPSTIKIDLFFHLRKIISAVLEDEIILKIRIRILNKKMVQSFLKSVIPAAK